jgi:hypothetical protein
LQDARLDSAESNELVRAALHDLPERYRTVLELHLIDGLSPLQVAERLGLPRSSVRVLLHRGRELLRRSLPRGMSALLLVLLLRRSSRAAPRWPVAALAAAVLVCFVSIAPAVWSASGRDAPRIAAAASGPDALTASSQSASSVEQREPVPAREELRISVLDANGRGVPAVGLTIEPRDGSDPRLHRELACTDSAGRAVLARRPGVPLRISADRGAMRELDGDARTCTLVVSGGLAVRGRVVDPRGAPLAHAGVWLGDIDGSRRGQIVARTADDGSFELAGVPASARIAALASGFRRTAMTAASAFSCARRRGRARAHRRPGRRIGARVRARRVRLAARRRARVRRALGRWRAARAGDGHAPRIPAGARSDYR